MALRRFVSFLLIAAFLIAVTPVQTLAWGDEGHKITALIAYALLNPRAKANVDVVLEGVKITDAAVWPDALKRAGDGCTKPGADCNPNYRPETTQWHFVDMPLNGTGKFSKTADYCRSTREGDCIVLAIEDFKDMLARSTRGAFADKRSEDKRKFHDALSFMVHFLGDIHQPLHCADNDDAGGNGVLVTWQNEPAYQWDTIWNLHSVWDEYLVTRNIMKMNTAEKTYAKYAASLVLTVSEAERKYAQMKSQTINSNQPETTAAWAESSFVVAKNSTYKLPTNTVTKSTRGAEKKDRQGQLRKIVVLDENYFNANMPEVERQLRLGGVRLARILNEIYDKDIH